MNHTEKFIVWQALRQPFSQAIARLLAHNYMHRENDPCHSLSFPEEYDRDRFFDNMVAEAAKKYHKMFGDKRLMRKAAVKMLTEAAPELMDVEQVMAAFVKKFKLELCEAPAVNDSLPSLIDGRPTDQLKIIEIMSRQASWRDPIPEDAEREHSHENG